MTIQELLKILINFIRKKSAGIQRHRFCHSLNSKNENIKTCKVVKQHRGKPFIEIQ